MVEEIENVASAKRLGGEGFEDTELSDIAELLDSHPQKIVQKYFSDAITSKVDREGHCSLTSRTQSMLKHPLCKSNCCDDSKQRDPSVEHLLTLRQGLNAYPQPYITVIRNLQTKANKSFLCLL